MPNLDKSKVLYVDDSRHQRRFAQRKLAPLQCEIVLANDGEEGLRILLADSDITHLRTDNDMPVMSGLQFLEMLSTQHQPRLQLLRHVVFKSAEFDSEERIGKEVHRVCAAIAELGVQITITEGAAHEDSVWKRIATQ